MKRDIIRAKVRGASHIRSGTPCQDSYKKQECVDGTIIMAVADGHGSKSCPFSKIGSHIAVDVFCKIMSEYIENFVPNLETLLTYLNREGDTKVAQAIDAEWKRQIYKKHKSKKRDIPLDENGEEILQQVYAQYGTTLLGLMQTEEFIFALQIGDGDIVFASDDGIEPVIKGDKILGVETHSLSKIDAWKNAITMVRRLNFQEKLPAMFLMSTDGFANSYKNEDEFAKTCKDYLEMLNEYGAKAVGDNLRNWLSETSNMGCGDDITVLMAYYSADDSDISTEEIKSDKPDIAEDVAEFSTDKEKTEAKANAESISTEMVATEGKQGDHE